jgi:spore germination protein PC
MTPGEKPTWPEYFRQLQAYLQWQTERIAELQRTVASLQSELAAVKEQKGVRIDKIEYSFDQLKVERLDGTLNIGITPGGLPSIEEFTVNGQPATAGTGNGPGVPVPGAPGGRGAAGAPGSRGTAGTPDPATNPHNMEPNVSAPPPNGGGGIRGGGTGAGPGGAADWVQQIGRQIKEYLNDDVADQLRRWVDERNLPLSPEEQRLVLDDIRAQLDDRVRYYAKQSGNRAAAGQTFDSVARDIIERTKQDIRTAIEMYVTGIQPAEGEL